MNFSKLFYSLMSLVVGMFFVTVGVIGIITPWVPSIKMGIIHFIQVNTLVILIGSFAAIAIGVAIITNIIIASRHRTYHIKAGINAISVDEKLIQSYLDSYWEQLFPKIDIPNHLVLTKNKIKIVADLPALPLDDQKKILGKIDEDLSRILEKVLGYTSDFTLSVSFKSSE